MRKDITQGSILKNLMLLSWPTVLAMAMHASYNLADIFWVGKIGHSAIASVALAGNVFFVVLAVAQTIGSGTIALVAQSFGSKNHGKVEDVLRQSLSLTATVALAISVLGVLFSPTIIRLLGGKGEVFVMGSQYLRIMFVGYFFHLLVFNMNYAFRGTGDMITPMMIMFVATLLNIGLDPLLIFGVGFFPRLGVQGAALATVIVKFCSFIIASGLLLRGKSGLKLRFRNGLQLEGIMVKTILRIGIPVGISYGLMAFSSMVVFRIVADFSSHALAALGISMRVLMISGLFVVGIGIATTTLIGQNLGARKRERVQKTAFKSMLLSGGVMAIASLLFFSQAECLIKQFSSDPGVINEGVQILRIVALRLVFVGLTMSMTGVFRGAGDTKPPMFAGLIKLILLILLALFLSKNLNMGVKGVWWAMVISYALETLVLGLWFKRGRWKERRIEILSTH